MRMSDFSCLVTDSRHKHTQGTNFHTDFPLRAFVSYTLHSLQNIPPTSSSHNSQSLPASHFITILTGLFTVDRPLHCWHNFRALEGLRQLVCLEEQLTLMLRHFTRGQLSIGAVAIIKSVVASPTSCFRFSTCNVRI